MNQEARWDNFMKNPDLLTRSLSIPMSPATEAANTYLCIAVKHYSGQNNFSTSKVIEWGKVHLEQQKALQPSYCPDEEHLPRPQVNIYISHL
jgi:hypothetical protein